MKTLYIFSFIISLSLQFSCENNSHINKNDVYLPPCKVIKWPPNTGIYNSFATGLTENTKCIIGVPEEFPIRAKGTTILSENGEFIPSKNNYSVIGGKFFSLVRNKEYYAEIKDWTYLYNDSAKTEISTYGYYAVQGELLLPNHLFEDTGNSYYVDNFFEATDFGKDFILIKLDSSQGHKLCIIEQGDSFYPTCGYIGTKIKTQNSIIERKSNGWYCDTVLISK